MEMMPYQAPLDAPGTPAFDAAAALAHSDAALAESTTRRSVPVMTAPANDDAPAWQAGLPTLRGLRLTLRELRQDDAPALVAQLTTDEVTRFISPPPTSVEGFERFIAWAHRRRSQGRYVCFAVVPEGQDTPVGMFQVHRLDDAGQTAEWGFVIGAAYWGRGLFLEGALLLLDFAFATLGVRRLEARACVANGRGTGALRKLGAVCERVLHRSFEKDGRHHDQGLWVLRPAWWRALVAPRSQTVH